MKVVFKNMVLNKIRNCILRTCRAKYVIVKFVNQYLSSGKHLGKWSNSAFCFTQQSVAQDSCSSLNPLKSACFLNVISRPLDTP